MSYYIGNTGTIDVNGIGIQITVGALNPSASFTINNSGTVDATLDGVQVSAEAGVTATGTFIIENSGTIKSTVSGRAINFDLSVAPPGSITITNEATGVIEAAAGEAIVIAGDSTDTITNKGIITGSISTGGGADTFNLFTGSSISGLLDSGLGNDTINLHGSGQGTLQSFTNVEVVNLYDGDWTLGSEGVTSVNFQDGLQTLSLDAAVLADGQFDATINNLSTGDIIDLTGIGLATSATLGANNVLTIAGGSSGPITLQLDPLQDFSGQVFQLISDGAGGTNVMLASMSEINNTGTIVGADFGILITVGAQDPGASWTIINSGTIEGGVDGVLFNADPSNLTATGTFIIDNSGTIKSTGIGHAINFDFSVSPPGSITITNEVTGVIEATAGEAIVIAGDSADTITNKGIITGGISTGGGADTFNLFTGSSISGLIDSGSGNDTINLYGSGQGTLQSFVNVEVVNLHGGDWVLGSEDVVSVNFQDGLQTLSLDAAVLADGQFDATINNLSTGDIIDLTGIGLATSATLGANNVLTITGGSSGTITLQLDPLQDFSGQVFQLISDGAGGTNVMLASMSEINNTGTIIGADFGILITVGAQDPGASWTIINSGTIEGGVDGVLVNADPFNLAATGTFVIDNSGVIESTGSGHAINFDLSVSPPGSIMITNQVTGVIEAAAGEAIVIAGDSADAIINEGTIIGSVSTGGGADTFNLFTGSSISGLVDSGLGNDTINLQGNGQGTLESFANVEVINLYGGNWTLGSEDVVAVNFQAGLQTLSLGTTVLADGQFDGTINNFATGDIIDLTGIGLATGATLDANNVLTIAGGSSGPIMLQLDPLQDFSGQLFQLTSDGAGGTNITLATAGGKDDDILGGTSGNDLISGGKGNDIIFSGEGNDQIFGEEGNDTIQTGDGSSILDGGKDDDVLTAGDGDGNDLRGGDGKDILTVGDGDNNILNGGDGADTFYVGTGNNNFLTGGKGGDTFVFGPDSGDNVITDFDQKDQIQFISVFENFQELLDASEQVGDDTVIQLDSDHTITLLGVSEDSLQASDFLFA